MQICKLRPVSQSLEGLVKTWIAGPHLTQVLGGAQEFIFLTGF